MKRMIYLISVFVLLFALTGCAAVFSNTYTSEQDFQGNEKIELDDNVQVVQNYSELRRLVFGMVNNHEASREIVFSGYTGNAVTDIASVCNAVKTESSYGAYCVEYVSYDLRQIVSSYEAKISISYLYTQDELGILQTTSNLESFSKILVSALEEENTKLLVRVNNGTAEEAVLTELMDNAILEYPMAISYVPRLNVKIFDGNSSQKIYEVSIQYDDTLDNEKRLKAMGAVLERCAAAIEETDAAKKVLSAADHINTHFVYNQDGGDTAYHALIEESANSRGISCAFKALCDNLGIECLIVSGRLEKQDHYWNIVKIEDAYYHVDVSRFGEIGAESTMFLSDVERQVSYWWNQSAYPACEGNLTYSQVISEK